MKKETNGDLDNKIQSIIDSDEPTKTDTVIPALKTIILILAASIISLGFGRLILKGVVYLYEIFQVRLLLELLTGMNVIFLTFLFVRHRVIDIYNAETEERLINRLPSNLEDLEKAGIHTPVDFCLGMGCLFVYEARRPYLVSQPKYIASTSPELWDHATNLFKQKFKREPYQYDENSNKTWLDYANYEIEEFFKENNKEIESANDILETLSPEFIGQFHVSVNDKGRLLFGGDGNDG